MTKSLALAQVLTFNGNHLQLGRHTLRLLMHRTMMDQNLLTKHLVVLTSAKQQGWDTRINLGTGGDSLIGGLNIFAGYSHSQRDPDLKANTNDDGQ